MHVLKSLGLSALAAGILLASSPQAPSQISVGIGVAPVCPYGYFDYAPYECAPYGYYGPDWFSGGVFIGAGPWFHRPPGWVGHVDNRYDPRHGYHGPFPEHGAPAFNHFQANEVRDGHSNIAAHESHSGGEEHALPGFHGGGAPHGGGGPHH